MKRYRAEYVAKGIRFGALTCALAVTLCCMGCSTPRYSLKAAPSTTSKVAMIGRFSFLNVDGPSASVAATADVFEFCGSKYLASIIFVTNVSNRRFDLSYDSVEMLYHSRNGVQKLVPLEPESLLKKLAQDRASHESSGNFGTVFLALLAARHDPGANTDFTKVNGTVQNRNSVIQSQSKRESNVIRELDEFLERKDSIEPGSAAGGYVLFPFVQSDSYTLRAMVGGEVQEFNFLLRSY